MKKTKSGTILLPKWIAFIIGGNWQGIGYNWYPGIFRVTIKYLFEGWYKNFSYLSFIKMGLHAKEF